MKKYFSLSILFLILFTTAAYSKENITFETVYFKTALDRKGFLTSFRDRKTGMEYLPEGESAPLLTLYKDSAYLKPVSAEYQHLLKKITLKYPNGSIAEIGTDTQKGYLKFRLISIEPRNGIEAVVWGPFPTIIDEKIGETICVVRDSKFAIGMQALDINTIEGLPDGDDNASDGSGVIDPLPGRQLPDSLIDKRGKRVNVNVNKTGDLPDYVRLYRGSAAIKKGFGSELRLFSRDRRIPRIINEMDGAKSYPRYVEPVNVDFAGSAIALFGCPEPLTLDIIGEIELGEGLPHPMVDGTWVRKSKSLGSAYLLNSGDQAQSIKYAKACGFSLIKIGDIFQTWGHFGLHTKRFPNGSADILKATEAARKVGISLGVHTLTMFTAKNDPYITPIPSDSLCKTGSTVLASDIGKENEIIYIQNPVFFRNLGKTHTVKIGKELVNYRKVSDDEPWRLLDCKRGQYGTASESHNSGSAIDKLTNNMYGGFYPGIHLQDAYARRLAEVCNTTGIGEMDFDGFNGSSPTGHGSYGSARFIDLWYKSLDKYVLTSGAGPFHYYWHIYSYMNWGEPWYSALRESQVNYRIENQRYFDRNLMPGMLGWFTLNPEFRPEEVEWIQARSAAFNAGYLLRVNETIESNGYKDQLFEAIREWQKARKANAFTSGQREQMKDPKNEFHLEKRGENSWELFPVKLFRGFVHNFREVQTGEPVATEFVFNNIHPDQPLQFYITTRSVDNNVTATVTNIQLEINNYQTLKLNATLRSGDNVCCDGQQVFLCDKTWNRLSVISTDKIPVCERGNVGITVTSDFSSNQSPKLEIEFKTVGSPEKVGN